MEENELRVGELYYVEYRDNMYETTGFLNKDGVHVLYSANGGQLYFRRILEDGAVGNFGFGNPCIKSIKPMF